MGTSLCLHDHNNPSDKTEIPTNQSNVTENQIKIQITSINENLMKSFSFPLGQWKKATIERTKSSVSYLVLSHCLVDIYCSEKSILYIFITVCSINLHKIAFATHTHTSYTHNVEPNFRTYRMPLKIQVSVVIVRFIFLYSCFNLFIKFSSVHSFSLPLVHRSIAYIWIVSERRSDDLVVIRVSIWYACYA